MLKRYTDDELQAMQAHYEAHGVVKLPGLRSDDRRVGLAQGVRGARAVDQHRRPADMEAMRPAGVTNQYRDIDVANPKALSDAGFMAGAAKISDGMRDALRTATSCSPDHLVLGVSAISFIGGRAGCDAFVQQVLDHTGLQISVGSRACVAALVAHATRAPVHASRFSRRTTDGQRPRARLFKEHGYTVVRDTCLRCTSWTDIAQQPESRLVQVLRELDGDDVDAIVQVGTNLSMVRLAAAAEVWLGKPVIAINTATYWHALRANGIDEPLDGFGRLLRDF